MQGSNEDADIVSRFVDTVGEWERHCKTTSLWEFALRSGKLKLGALWQPRAVGSGERWEESSTGRGHMSAYGWFICAWQKPPTQCCKAIIFQFKINFKEWPYKKKKKAEHWRTDAYELWCWIRLFSVPWTARRSNQTTLKEISPEYSLQGLMLKLKLQYLGHLMWRTDSCEKTLMLGKTEGRRRRGQERIRLLDGITDAMDMSLSRL